jgi:predicted ATPase
VALLEREPQLQAVAGYLAEAANGHGRMVFVAGEAGNGKTIFVGQVLADAAHAARVAIRHLRRIGDTRTARPAG